MLYKGGNFFKQEICKGYSDFGGEGIFWTKSNSGNPLGISLKMTVQITEKVQKKFTDLSYACHEQPIATSCPEHIYILYNLYLIPTAEDCRSRPVT